MNRFVSRSVLAVVVSATGWSSSRSMLAADDLFRRDNLVAWCIVPFDAQKRGPEERAAMLERLGFRHFAYDSTPGGSRPH